jgi:hypothetical protein
VLQKIKPFVNFASVIFPIISDDFVTRRSAKLSKVMKTPPRSVNFWRIIRPIGLENFPLMGGCVGLPGDFAKTLKIPPMAADRRQLGRKMFRGSSKFLKLCVTNQLGSGDR